MKDKRESKCSCEYINEFTESSSLRACKAEYLENPVRLDKYLGDRFSYYSRTRWQKIIKNGLVKLNGEMIKYKRLVRNNDVITYKMEGVKEPSVSRDVKILYDDGDLIIVNKPANLPVIPSGKYYKNTLYTILCEMLNLSSIRMLNRIDRETSGCVALARSHEMASKFSTLMKNNMVRKLYLAIVENASSIPEQFSVEGNMIETPSKYFRRYQTFTNSGGRYSKTKFKTLKRYGKYAVILARLYTGRMHQIRVHLKEIGYFLVGDKIYGSLGDIIFDKFVSSACGEPIEGIFQRQALHAYKLKFRHPITDVEVVIKAPIPKDMKIFLKEIDE